MTRAELLDLAARVEAAPAEMQGVMLLQTLDLAEDAGWLTNAAASRAREWVRLGAYESAALTLVPEGWRWIVDGDGNATCLPCGMRGNPVEHIYAATPALALTSAALRARAEEISDDR